MSKSSGRSKLQTMVTPWVSTHGKSSWDNSVVAGYRIWLETNGREWWQRHEWINKDGSSWIEDWIDTPMKKFPNHYILPEDAKDFIYV